MQVFYVAAGRREPIVGVVGALQLDVITSRLQTEYGVSVAIEPASFSCRSMGRRSDPAAALARRPAGRGGGPARAARAPVRIGMGATVFPAAVS